MNGKYVYFVDQANYSAGFPADSLIDIRYNSATEAEMFFEGNQGTDSCFRVVLTITSGKVDNVLKSLARAIQSHRGPIVTIADDVNSTYLMSEIEGISALTAADATPSGLNT
jgi:hypothetical protein